MLCNSRPPPATDRAHPCCAVSIAIILFHLVDPWSSQAQVGHTQSPKINSQRATGPTLMKPTLTSTEPVELALSWSKGRDSRERGPRCQQSRSRRSSTTMGRTSSRETLLNWKSCASRYIDFSAVELAFAATRLCHSREMKPEAFQEAGDRGQ